MESGLGLADLEFAVGTSWKWERLYPLEQLTFWDVECGARSPGLCLGTSER